MFSFDDVIMDWTNITDTFAKSKILLTEKVMIVALVTSTAGLLPDTRLYNSYRNSVALVQHTDTT